MTIFGDPRQNPSSTVPKKRCVQRGFLLGGFNLGKLQVELGLLWRARLGNGELEVHETHFLQPQKKTLKKKTRKVSLE